MPNSDVNGVVIDIVYIVDLCNQIPEDLERRQA